MSSSPSPSQSPGQARQAAPREQEQSIKERKQLLFEKDVEEFEEEEVVVRPRKPFKDYLRTTPPMPVSKGVKTLLWSTGAVVILLFVVSLLIVLT